jgi:hypothetical protein
MKLSERTALGERLRAHEQVPSAESVGGLPPYVESFHAPVRLLVGVPFQYLVPDARLLPDESLRFFYVDRSFTDRLVDGALAVGKVGTRELAHLEAHAAAVHRSADVAEVLVRGLQRGKTKDYVAARTTVAAAPAQVISGLLLRSALVSDWPHLEVRAFAANARLVTARLERLSPGVLIALFRGVPDRVELEEPHHGVQFGVKRTDAGGIEVTLRDPQGVQVDTVPGGGVQPVRVRIPMRSARGVVHVAALRKAMHLAQRANPVAIPQHGSAAFALTVLAPPYQQPFGEPDEPRGARTDVAGRVQDLAFGETLRRWVSHGG